MRTIKLGDSDKALIEKVKEYQVAHGIPSFVGAIRKLCQVALEVEKIRH